MTKVAINKRFGGFGLSYEGIKRLAELKGFQVYCEDQQPGTYSMYYTTPSPRPDDNADIFDVMELERDDPDLIRTIEELDKDANGEHANLEIVDIPRGVRYRINLDDGYESIEYAPYDRDWKIA